MSAPAEDAAEAWEKLQAQNKFLGCEFWEGVVAQNNHAEYPIQLRSPDEETPSWSKHRWSF